MRIYYTLCTENYSLTTIECDGFFAPMNTSCIFRSKTSVQIHHKGLKAVEPKVFSAEKKTKSCNTKAAMRDNLEAK